MLLKRIALLLGIALIGLAPIARAQSPISLGPDGTVLMAGRPYRGVGVVYFDCFLRYLKTPSNLTFKQGFQALHRKNIPFCRFMATGYWPVEMNLYFQNRAVYFARMDSVVAAARANNVGLIPVIFWTHFTWADLAHEPVSKIGDPNSVTRAMMRQYATEMVSRYKDSPAIWAWEIGNELNDWVDIAQFGSNPPPVAPIFGTPNFRTAADDIYAADLLSLVTDISSVIHDLDPSRLIISGHNIPRTYAESLRLQEVPLEMDTPQDYQANFAASHPGFCNTASMHLYPEFAAEARFTPGTPSSYPTLLGLAEQACTLIGKPLYIGEFGSNDVLHGGSVGARAQFEAELQAFVESGADLAAAWVYDRVTVPGVTLGAVDSAWIFNETLKRTYVLDDIAATNAIIQANFVDAPQPTAGRLRLAVRSGLPSRREVRLELRSPVASAMRLELFDLSGRRVASHESSGETRELTLAWSPAAGTAGGVYMARASGAGEVRSQKVVVLR